MGNLDDLAHIISGLRTNLSAFERDANQQFAAFESAVRPRILTLQDSRAKLAKLSLKQEVLFNEALSCVEFGLNRAAIVSAWIAFADVVEEKLASDRLVKVFAVRSRWDSTLSIHELREQYGEFQVIEVAHDTKLINKQVKKYLHGQLSVRNDCAHGSAYQPDTNEALGYISGLLQRANTLKLTPY
jgi:hypothetical protein